MQVNITRASNMGNQKNAQNRKQVSFNASPSQILNKLETAQLCPGKKSFLESIAMFFKTLEEKISEQIKKPYNYTYKLGENNNIPEEIRKIEVDGFTLKEADIALNQNSFKCSPSASDCGEGKTKGNFAKKMFEILGVENPSTIEISANKGV